MPDRLFDARPLTGLVEGWEAKLPVAMIGGLVVKGLKYVGGLYADLLYVKPLLVTVVVTLMACDFVTGIVASRIRGRRIRSKRMRATGWKVIEYAFVVLVCVLIDNAFSDTPFDVVTGALAEASLLYVAITEGISVIENVTGSRDKAFRIWKAVRGVLKSKGDGDLPIEQEAGDTDATQEAPYK